MATVTREQGLHYSLFDGAFAAMMGSLAGGVFLMGFALKVLHATPAQIGLLAALPMVANVIQMFGSYVIEKTGRKKRLCTTSVVVSRILWILVILIPLALFANLRDLRVAILVAIIAVSSLFGSLGNVAWLSWMADLVPPETRGRYFGKRNMIASFAGMVITVIGGRFLTSWNQHFSDSNPFGYVILFAAGLAFGLVSSWFLSRMPESQPPAAPEGTPLSPSRFLLPLKDHSFVALILFVSLWSFGIQLAAPFYNVYMIEFLRLSFSNMALLATLSTLTTLIMMKVWGPISDRLGNRPVIVVSTWVLILIPFIWIAATPRAPGLPLLVAFALSGAFMAGASLSQFNILIKLSPQRGRSIYLALFAAITGLAGAIAPIVGGFLVRRLSTLHLAVAGHPIIPLDLLFLLSSAVQLVALVFLAGVREESAATPMAVILQLRNDLNPQTGIAGTADFMIVELQRGQGLLREIDRRTDELAARTERSVGRFAEEAERLLRKPLARIRALLRDDDDRENGSGTGGT